MPVNDFLEPFQDVADCGGVDTMRPTQSFPVRRKPLPAEKLLAEMDRLLRPHLLWVASTLLQGVDDVAGLYPLLLLLAADVRSADDANAFECTLLSFSWTIDVHGDGLRFGPSCRDCGLLAASVYADVCSIVLLHAA